MFGSVVDRVPAAGGPVVRVPFAALAARPGGLEAALLTEQLATVLTAAGTATSAAADTDPAAPVDPPGETPGEAVAVERDLVDEIAAAERVRARAEATQIRAMAELAGRPMFAGCAEHGHGDPSHGIRGAASIVSAELRRRRPWPGWRPGASWCRSCRPPWPSWPRAGSTATGPG
jgi:hypothetical protein